MSETSGEKFLSRLREIIAARPMINVSVTIPAYHSVIATAIRGFRNLDEKERAYVIDGLSDTERGVLVGFGSYAAVLAVREQDAAQLSDGLLAFALANFQPDYRDDYRQLVTLRRSCELLNVPVIDAFTEAAQWATPSGRDHLIGFARHPYTLADMHVVEDGTGADFTYKRDWSSDYGIAVQIHKIVAEYRKKQVNTVDD